MPIEAKHIARVIPGYEIEVKNLGKVIVGENVMLTGTAEILSPEEARDWAMKPVVMDRSVVRPVKPAISVEKK